VFKLNLLTVGQLGVPKNLSFENQVVTFRSSYSGCIFHITNNWKSEMHCWCAIS